MAPKFSIIIGFNTQTYTGTIKVAAVYKVLERIGGS